MPPESFLELSSAFTPPTHPHVQLETVEFQPHGDTGWESGQAMLKAKDGSVVDRLQYVVVWKKEDGQWKWHRDIWKSSQATG